MKKLIAIIALSTLMGLTLSARSIPEKLDRLVDNIELNCENYSPEDWDKAASEYRELVGKYYDSKESFSDAEKMMAARAIGRYHALIVKKGIGNSLYLINDFGMTIPEYLKGFSENIDNYNLGETLKEFIEKIDIDGALKSLESSIESFIGDIEESEPAPAQSE